MWKLYADLTKFGIVIFVVLTGLAGYATSFQFENPFVWQHLATLLGGLYFLSSGSLALNQVQEYKIDRLMPRTQKRPIASGKLKPAAGLILAVTYLLIGSGMLAEISLLSLGLGWLTVVLYNGVYTYWWKPKWVFGAVPGAIPGALPVTIGYAANTDLIFNSESVYLFAILFLWQMPHFWCLALRFKNDYQAGMVPTLPAALGVRRTLYHMGLYIFLYAGLAIASPWFVNASWMYILFVVPFAVKVVWDFFKLLRSEGEKGWLGFFLWTNTSVLVFLFVPVVDKWNFLFIASN